MSYKTNLDKRKSKRPPNRTCKVCGRKSIQPEADGSGGWYFRSVSMCFKCVMLQDEMISEIQPGKRILIKSVKESETVFPLRIFDKKKNKLVGQFNQANKLRKRLDLYRADNPLSRIMILDKKYHDFSDYFMV